MSNRRKPQEGIKLKVARLRSWFPDFARVNLKITDKDGKLVPLILNRMQIVLWAIIIQLIQQGKPIRIYLVKARQLGSTTFFTAVLYWLITLNKNKRVIGIAQDDEAAENLNLRWQNFFWNSRKELRPRFRKMNPKMIHFATPLKEMRSGLDIGLDSMMVVKTADSPQLGRSYTYNGAILTEFCIWPQLGIDVKSRMVALNQAIPKRPNTCIFIESTAQGDNYGRKFWDDKFNGYTKVFVSWLADDFYRKRLGKNFYFELEADEDGRYGNELKERKNILAQLRIWYPEREFNRVKFPGDELFTSYEQWLNYESHCRLAWRRDVINTECEGDKDEFRREYPTTIQDAFGVSSKSVFGAIRLLQSKEFIERSGILPKRFSYSPVQSEVRTATVRDVLKPFSKGKVRIYELPRAGAHYVCGADPAQGGPDSDDSAFVIFRLEPSTGQLVEVCSYNDKIEATEFAGLLYLICNFYNKALLGIERNDKAGFAVLEILRKEVRYSRLYWAKDPLSYKRPAGSKVRWGWLTDEANRQIMVKDGITWFRKEKIFIRSKEILEQMDTFIENPKTGKIAASAGNHDDLVMATLIAGQLSKQVHIHEDVSKKKIEYGTLEWFMRMSEIKKGKRYGQKAGKPRDFYKGSGARRKLSRNARRYAIAA
jgi:hypothetical protein